MALPIDVFHRWPNWLTFAAVTLTLCAIAMAMPHLRRRLFRFEPDEKTATAAMDGIKAVATFLVFILAISLNQVMGQQREAAELVQREASLLNQFDRGLLRVGIPELQAMRPRLVEYARVTATEEWPLMSEGGRSERAYEILASIVRAVRLTEVESPRQQAIYADMIRTMEALNDVRDARLAASRLALPELFWAVLGLGILLLLPLCAMTAGTLNSALLKMAIVGSVAILICLVGIINRPFSGETRVAPAAIERAIERMANRVI